MTRKKDMMDLSDALRALRDGARIHRAHWERVDGPDVWVAWAETGWAQLAESGGGGGETVTLRPHAVVRLADGSFAPWTPTQVDLLAGDWVTRW